MSERVFFSLRFMAAVRGRSSGLPGFLGYTGSPTRVQRPPFFVWRQKWMAQIITQEVYL